MDRPTFSPSWSRVSRLTPVLRPQVQVHRQVFRGEPWHVVHDPVSNTFFRLNPVAYHLIALLDGKRMIDEVWRLTLDRFGDDAPTQNEVIGLLSQLNESNLLRMDLPADAAPLLKRSGERRRREWTGQLLSILYLRVPLFNPDRFLGRLLPLVRPLLTRWGLALWCVWMFAALWQFLPHVGEFITATRNEDLLAPANWGWMLAVFIFIKAIHETGHGLMCKRFGGVVPEVGISMMVALPAPYVNATSSWNFPSKWQRLLVGAAGMLFELAVAAGAALLWLRTQDGLVRQLAHHAVLLASVTTLAFNANPLLRFDGYYMLSDLMEVPNLYERSSRQLRWIAQRFLFGMKNVQPPASALGEQIFLALYGATSSIYRVFVVTGIMLFLMGQWFTIGLIAAVWSFIAFAVVPVVKYVYWLLTNPSLEGARARAIGVTAAGVLALVIGLDIVPVEDHRRATGVVESDHSADLALGSDGFVTAVRADAGQHVHAGQILVEAENPELRAQQKDLLAQLKRLHLIEKESLADDLVAYRTARAKIETIEQELHNVEERLDALVLRSPQDGTLLSAPTDQLIGRFLKRGEVIGRVIDMRSLRVTALVDQSQNASAFFDQIDSAEIRPAGRLDQALPSRVIKTLQAGRSTLPHPALGYLGGGDIPTDPQDTKGRKTQRPQFELWLELPTTGNSGNSGGGGGRGGGGEPVAFPGERVYVRFTLKDRKPLLEQWAQWDPLESTCRHASLSIL